MSRLFVVILLALWPLVSQAQGDAPLTPGAKVAFLGITFIDTSTEGAYSGGRADEAARLTSMEQTVRDRFVAEGFDIVSTAPVAQELEGMVNPARCNGCELRMAERLGAKYSLVGEVQKVSNLILSMNLVLRDVQTGTMVRGLAMDIRSNTDESWLRGAQYILKYNFFPT